MNNRYGTSCEIWTLIRSHEFKVGSYVNLMWVIYVDSIHGDLLHYIRVVYFLIGQMLSLFR